MSNFTVDNIMQVFPGILAEDENQNALGTAIANLMIYLHPDLDLFGVYNRIDELPEEVCDILARDLKVDWYNYNYPVKAKRNLIKTNWYVHKHLGTVGAVKTAIQAVYPDSDVEEWWQDWYNGEPYHFRIMLEASGSIVPVSNTDILREVGLYKSLRSHLDGVIFRSSENIVIKTGTSWIIYSGRLAGTYPVIARQGSIEDHGIVVYTSATGIGYRNPYTGEIYAGTFPQPAVPGNLTEGNIVVETANGGTVYRNPYTGEIYSGSYPEIAEAGGLSGDLIAVQTVNGNIIYRNPATGEISTGTFPDTAVSGSVQSGALSATSEGQGISYTGKLCGDGLIFY